jgi:two-component system, NarL family, response regulator LiaR
MDKIRVLVADDHPAFREGLCKFLSEETDMEVVAKPENGEEAVQLARELKPDVAVLDVAMPKLNGVDAARQIVSISPKTAILVVSAFGYEAYLLASIRAGAAGYMLKNAPVSDLVSAVRMVHRGEALFNLKSIRQVLSQLSIDGRTLKSSRTELRKRELETLKLVARGMSNKEIAEKLFISERTVQTHLFNVFKKLDTGSRTEAVLRAVREGWLTMDDLPGRGET